MINPLDGGRRSIQVPDPPLTNNIQVTSEILRRLFGLEARPTVWEEEGGRPIYDRLPSASEAYKKTPEDTTAGRVFLPPDGSRGSGIGSLQPLLLEGNRVGIQSGIVSWPEGTTQHEQTFLDITPLGLESSRWFLGYELQTDDTPRAFRYQIQDQNLQSIKGWEVSSPLEICGMESIYAIQNTRDRFFSPQAELNITFSTFANFNKIQVPILLTSFGKQFIQSNPATLSTNLNPGVEIVGRYDDSKGVIFFENLSFNGAITELTIRYPLAPVYSTSIKNILFDGIIDVVTPPENNSYGANLVIYNLEDEEVRTSILCLLAYFETNSQGIIQSFRDIRRITAVKNEPVAKWLTEPFDEDLVFLYGQYKNFADKWMNPRKLGETIYSREINRDLVEEGYVQS